uniref:Glycosyl transferase 64 domain-containing protein n=1 Tax=Amphora coffeiformis TaxID=265554 RepID=A0A7S3LE13_9STRA
MTRKGVASNRTKSENGEKLPPPRQQGQHHQQPFQRDSARQRSFAKNVRLRGLLFLAISTAAVSYFGLHNNVLTSAGGDHFETSPHSFIRLNDKLADHPKHRRQQKQPQKKKREVITLVCLTVNPERFGDLRRIVAVAVEHPLIARVVIVWNGLASERARLVKELNHNRTLGSNLETVVDILTSQKNSLNNRYDRSFLNVTTEAVMILDDDLAITPDTIYCAHESWVKDKVPVHSFGRGRGVYPYDEKLEFWAEDRENPSDKVNFLLPHMIFLSDYLDTYFDPLYDKVREVVDNDSAHCDDIAFASIITQQTRTPMKYVPAPYGYRNKNGKMVWKNHRQGEEVEYAPDKEFVDSPALSRIDGGKSERILSRRECSRKISSILDNWTLPIIEWSTCAYQSTSITLGRDDGGSDNIIKGSQIPGNFRQVAQNLPFYSVFATADDDDKSSSKFLKWTRQAVDAICPLSSNSLRPESVVVPGKFAKLSSNNSSDKNADASLLINQTSPVGREFLANGLAGPLQTSHSQEELTIAFDAIQKYHQSIRKSKNALIEEEASEYLSWNQNQLNGERDVLMSRCYAFDPLCDRLVRDPLIVEAVKDVIGENIIVTSIDEFGKSEGEIQPWHTDIEPYDRCYGRNVQIWLGVDQVTPESTLQIMSQSHRMPSLTWLYPEHVMNAKTIADKRNFEAKHLLPCAQALDPSARVFSPVTQNGEFVLFHSQMWHAAEVNRGSPSFRRAIRITYSTPDCRIGHHFKYERPDLPPMRPVPSLPLVMLVSGSVRSLPDFKYLPNNFVHMRHLRVGNADEAQVQRRHDRLSRKATTTAVRIWNLNDIESLSKTVPLPDASSREKSDLLIGNTPLFSAIEFSEVSLNPHEVAHEFYDEHEDGDVKIVTKSQIGHHELPFANSSSLLLSYEPARHYLESSGIAPTLHMLDEGAVSFIDSNGPHNDVGGPNGGRFFRLKFRVRQEHAAIPIAPRGSQGLSHQAQAPKSHSFVKPPLDKNAVDGQKFFVGNGFAGLGKVVGFTCRCVHNPHPDVDHEVLMIVDSIPNDVELFSLPDGQQIVEGAALYYPLNTTHGIEARQTSDGKLIPYRSKRQTFSDFPRCLVIEFWSSKSKQ